MKLVILAGGKGTRLGLKDIPKPMVKINGKPLLEYQILLAKKYNITDIYIMSGHLSEVIIDYFGDGSKWNVNITHIVEDIPLGTAGALKQIEDQLNEKFIVLYGDTVIGINLKNFIDYEKTKLYSIGALVAHPNDHPYDSDLLEIDKEFKVIKIHNKPHEKSLFYSNLVNAALYILSPKIFQYIEKDCFSDLAKDIFPKLISENNLYVYKTSEYIKDMGTQIRLKEVEKDIIKGKVEKLNKSFPQVAIFLDRDGVINREMGNLTNIDSFILIEGVPESIKKINKSEYVAIIITNQPVIAKGFVSVDELNHIHKKMDTLLGYEGAYIDDLYYCPHHPDKGFENEIEQLKFNCDCRKPKIGMLLKAASDHNIDLKRSWMIGDRYADIMAGSKAGCRTVLLNTGHAGNDKNKYENVEPDFVFNTLNEAVDFILSRLNKNDNN